MQTLSAVVLCVVAAGAGLGIDQAAGPGRTAGPVHHGSPHPSPTTAPTTTPTRRDATPAKPRLTALQIAQNPRSFVVASAVAPHDAGQAATLWEMPPAGPKAQFALTTTVDGFRHVRYVDLPAPYRRDCMDVRAVGNHRFWVSCELTDLLVNADGTVTEEQNSRGSQLVPTDAVLVPGQSTGGGVTSNWIDENGLLHDVAFPGSAFLTHSPDGKIWGITIAGNDLVWSTDGGRGWTSRPLPPVPAGRNITYELVPTAEPGQMVVARGSAETVFRPHSLLRFGPATELHQKVTRITFPTDPGAMDSAVVTADGSLVMELYNEPDRSSGLFRATAGHWTDLHKVMDLPKDADGRPAGSLWMGNAQDSSGKPLVWAVFRSGVIATSTDDGQTWTTRSIR